MSKDATSERDMSGETQIAREALLQAMEDTWDEDQCRAVVRVLAPILSSGCGLRGLAIQMAAKQATIDDITIEEVLSPIGMEP